MALIVENEDEFRLSGGIKGLRAAQIRAIFYLPPHLSTYADPLVYIHWFRRFNTPERVSGLYVIAPLTNNRHRKSEVVNVRKVLRGCHLIPRFGLGPVNPSSGPDRAVDDYLEFYFNRYIDLHLFHDLQSEFQPDSDE